MVSQLDKSKSKKKIWIIFLVIVLILGGGGYWFFIRQAEAVDTKGNVDWIEVEKGNVEKTISLTGTLNPANQATLTSSGEVTSIYVKTNDQVKKGQKIAQLDTSGLNIQLKQAEAQLDQAKSQLEQVEQITTTVNEKGQSTTQEPNEYSIEQAEANVEQQEANVESIVNQIADCTVKSSIAGTVTQVMDMNSSSTNTSSSSSNSSNGSNASSSNSNSSGGSTIAIITNLSTDSFLISANVSQTDAEKIAVGQSASAVLSNDAKTKLTATVKEISYLPQSDSGVTTYPVVLQVDKPNDSSIKLLPGVSAEVTITQEKKANVLRLTTSAITQQQGKTGVYVKGTSETNSSNQRGNLPEGLQFVSITVGLYGGEYVEVKSGLKQGDQVAIYNPITPSSESSNSNSGQGQRNNLMGGGMTGGNGGGPNGGFQMGNGGQGTSRGGQK